MNLGKGQNLVWHMVYNSFCISESGCTFIDKPHPISLPQVKKRDAPTRDNDANSQRATRQGKGYHALPTIRHLMCSSERWYEITNDEDYYFPGVFDAPHPQRMGFCPDITQLPKYDTTNPHFIYADISSAVLMDRFKPVLFLTVLSLSHSTKAWCDKHVYNTRSHSAKRFQQFSKRS